MPEPVSRLAYTTKEVALLLGISARTVCRMAENGSLPHKRAKGREQGGRGVILIPVRALERWLSNMDESRPEIAKSAVAKMRKVR